MPHKGYIHLLHRAPAEPRLRRRASALGRKSKESPIWPQRDLCIWHPVSAWPPSKDTKEGCARMRQHHQAPKGGARHHGHGEPDPANLGQIQTWGLGAQFQHWPSWSNPGRAGAPRGQGEASGAGWAPGPAIGWRSQPPQMWGGTARAPAGPAGAGWPGQGPRSGPWERGDLRL